MLPHDTPMTLNRSGVAAFPVAPGARSGYVAVALTTVTPGVAEVSVAVMPVAGAPPLFVSGNAMSQTSFGSMTVSLSPLTSVVTGAPACSRAAAGAPTASSAARAMTMPAPVSRSTPGASMSIAEAIRPARSSASVTVGTALFISAAIAAACGAAADVPPNGLNAGRDVVTPSAAVRSGFWRTTPPVFVRLPGVISLPSGFRMIRRGPSEVNVSLTLAGVNGPGKGPSGGVAGAAATLIAPSAALCPRVAPLVARAGSRRPRTASRLNIGGLEVEPAADRVTTRRSPANAGPVTSTARSSPSTPSCVAVLASNTTVNAPLRI